MNAEGKREIMTLSRAVANAVELGIRLHREDSPIHRWEEFMEANGAGGLVYGVLRKIETMELARELHLATAKGETTMDSGKQTDPWPFRGRRISAYRAWEYLGTEPAWQDRILALAEAAWEGSNSDQMVLFEMDELVAKARGHELVDDVELKDKSAQVARLALGFGAVLGYALCRKHPQVLEALDEWIELALDYGGLRDYPPIQYEASDEDGNEGTEAEVV